MKKILPGFLLAISVLLMSCAGVPPETGSVKQCSDTPHDAISTFLRGIRELSLSLLRAVTPKGTSLYKVFGGGYDEHRGKEVIRQMSANPEVSGESGGCACSLLSMTDTADPAEKIVTIKRLVTAGDDMHDYRRAFRVRFDMHGNCILAIDPVDSKWKRIF